MPPRRKKPARRTTTARPTAPATPPTVLAGERLHVLSVPFEERGVANANGARWDPYLRQTIHVGPALPRNLSPYASDDYSWERWVEDDINGISVPTMSSAPMTPRPHQVEAIDRIADSAARGFRGFLEADDVGLGKTIAAWMGALRVAEQRGATTVLVMCPKGVIPHWRRTIAAMGDAGLRVCVINYDQAKKLLAVPESAQTAARTRTKNKRIATTGTSLVEWDLIIADESHKMKNAGSQRRAAFSRIARYSATASSAPFVIWMSATAGQNPVELGYLAPLLAQLTGAKRSDLADFGQWLADEGFCVTYNARFKKWDWGLVPTEATASEVATVEAAKARDLRRIRDLLFAGTQSPAIRRLPEDIAGWPTIVRIPYPVDLDPGARAQYEQAWTEFRAGMNLARRGNDPKREGYAARLRFRQKASLLRVEGTVDLVTDLLENGHQVVVSVEFLETLDAIRDHLARAKVSVGEYSGRNAETRETERLAFQTGRHRVMVFTVTEGISLHQGELLQDGTLATDAPRTTVLHDPRYSGIEGVQIEGRAHRDGKPAPVYYPYAARTVEEKIVRTLTGRILTMKEMVGDDVSGIAQLQAILEQTAEATDAFEGPSAGPAAQHPAPPALGSTAGATPGAMTRAASPGRGAGATQSRSAPAQRPGPAAPAAARTGRATPTAGRSSGVTKRSGAARAPVTMTPEEAAFRAAMAGKKNAPATAKRREPDLGALREGLRDR